jgi:two-component system LytT family sensor kinase
MTEQLLLGTSALLAGTEESAGDFRNRSEDHSGAAAPAIRDVRRLRGRARPALLLVGAAALLSLFFASQYFIAARHFGQPIAFGKALTAQLVCWNLWAAAVPLVLWLARRLPIERSGLARRITLHLSAGLALSALHVLVETAIFQAFPLGSRRVAFGQRLQSVFVGEFHADVIAYLVILAAGHAIGYYRRYRIQELKRTKLEARLARAELEHLRTQLDPDFLFNTLHAISSLMHRDVEAADRIVSRLAEMLRVSLEFAGRSEVALREEVEFLERYLEIQQARFPGRLAVALRIEPGTLDGRVPCRILQPLVESAIGRRNPPGSRRIEMSSRRLEDSLELRVRDTGQPPPYEEGIPADEAGLSSTRERLTHLYGDRHRIEVRKGSSGCVSVTLSIPFRIDVQEEFPGHTASDLEDSSSDRR